MKYGFVIDNRKCIGCHACTVACKSEHDVPVGVNRTWVKQVEKGTFPDTRRLFSVMRCNHCTDAPCVDICPTEALFIRKDGIVDFDNDRCIGCKACMQACPYDALYIDPETSTAAKCNYCAHRVDVGLEPACVNVCPEHAIISGDMEDPTTEISQLLAHETVTVRKAEKGTNPNLFYIDGDLASLNPNATEKTADTLWSNQTGGVGHFARYADKKLVEGKSLVEMAQELSGEKKMATPDGAPAKKSIEVMMEKAKRVYDSPNKGILWGKDVAAYVWTKALSTGAFLMLFLANVLGIGDLTPLNEWGAWGFSMFFLVATTFFLVKDLDQAKRFAYVLLRPNWTSWLVKGGYALTFYGGLLTLWAMAKWLNLAALETFALWSGAAFAIITAVYTAFLFAQAKGRDFWQSPILPLHMLVHSLMAGSALLGMFTFGATTEWAAFLKMMLGGSIAVNLLILGAELSITHPTEDAKRTVDMIVSGRYKKQFWLGVVLCGNILPLVMLLSGLSTVVAFAGFLAIVGIFFTELIWVEAPQRIELS